MDSTVESLQELTPAQQPSAGGKGGALARLIQAGFPVPEGFVILPSAFSGDDLEADAWARVQTQLSRIRSKKSDIAFAVRSSALGEDTAQASFAGEFETVLNVHSDEEIHKAIRAVRCSRKGERAQAYAQAKGMDTKMEMAVVVQVLVPAEFSGVLFTSNPVTGDRDQAMLTATWGLGESIVGGLVTPDTLTLDKNTGHVLGRETADKKVMTVLAGKGTQRQPVPEVRRRAAVLSDAEGAELVRIGAQIEKLFGTPVDIEWTRAANEFAIVQARPITALPEAEPPAPSSWTLPKGVYAAMRNNIVELMAEPLTPLFSTLGRETVNTSMNRLITYFMGRSGVLPEEAIITVNGYAYYNGSLRAVEVGRILIGSVGIMKRMFTGAVERWTNDAQPRYLETVEGWKVRPWRELPATDLLQAVRELMEAAITAFGALFSGVIPAAWISEGLFTLNYRTLIKRRSDPPAPAYLLGFDSTPILAEKSLFDLAEWVRQHGTVAAYVARTPGSELAHQLEATHAPMGISPEDWREWQGRVRAHLERFGHMIYNLDFSNAVPADDPAPVLETLRMFVGGQAANPHARQQTAAERRERATHAILSRLKGPRLSWFRKSLATAQRYAPLREDGLAELGRAYPLVRQMLRELGRRLAQGGMIEKPDDVFWLTQEEAEQGAASLHGGGTLAPLTAVIPQRQASWRVAKRLTPPVGLFRIRFLGMEIAGKSPMRLRERAGNTLKGVPASAGRVTAPACVLHGPQDFARMRAGDVLVASITTPAWTPLFARAAAVVTDVGGPLSHGSIVAREFGIPAVMGTGSATRRIRSGQTVTVDGSAGTVTLTD